MIDRDLNNAGVENMPCTAIAPYAAATPCVVAALNLHCTELPSPRHTPSRLFYVCCSPPIVHSAALTITNGVHRAAIEEAKARHSSGISTATPPPLAPPPQSPQTLARLPTPPPPPLSRDEVVTKQRNKDESFFALVNASRGGAAREATVLGYHITPLFLYYAYHGPIFRVLLRLNRGKIHDSRHYGYIGYCHKCGNSHEYSRDQLGQISCSCSMPMRFISAEFGADPTKPGLNAPPSDKVTIFGDGNTKGVFVKENDVAAFTISTVDEPRTLNKVLYLRPSENVYSLNELVEMWETKIGKKLEKSHVSEEELIKKIEGI
ncbi:hypothetical protein HN51_066678 [Arachis hypogaea]